MIYHRRSIAVQLLGAFLVAACPVAIAYGGSDDESKPATSKAASSLDEQLLKGLDNELLEGLDDKSAEKAKNAGQDDATTKNKTDGRPTPSKAKSNSLDDELLGDLGGEDLGPAGKAQDPLVGIGRRMRTVESRLVEQQLDDQTRTMQQKILDDLSALVQECKKCQGGGNKPSSKSSKPSRRFAGGHKPGPGALGVAPSRQLRPTARAEDRAPTSGRPRQRHARKAGAICPSTLDNRFPITTPKSSCRNTSSCWRSTSSG